MWDRAPNLGNMYLKNYVQFPFCIGNIEVPGDRGQALGKNILSQILNHIAAAPSASLQSHGIENSPLAGTCKRYPKIPFDVFCY